MTLISMIAAMSENRVIGKNNTLPWHIPEDLKFFKETTLNKPIIMGRKTFESMGSKPLPHRFNIILTNSVTELAHLPKDCHIAHSVEEALLLAGESDEIMIIGGAKIYEQFLPKASRLYLSIVHKVIEGDTFFPEIKDEEWKMIHKIEKSEFTIQIFDRITHN